MNKIRNVLSLLLVGMTLCGGSLALAADLELTETDGAIRVSLRGKPVLNYVKKSRDLPQGVEEHYRRTGYIHPVYSPSGEEVSGDYPLDHAHQHALFFAWTKSTFDGKKVDFWNQAKQLAGVEFREVVRVKRDEKQVSFQVKHAFTVGQGDKKTDVLHELWTVTVHRTPSDYFLFDLESTQQCAADKPLVLEKYHYGGMAFRGNVEWLRTTKDKDLQPGQLRFLTSEGKGRWEGNHTRPDWVAMSGKIGGQDVSMAIMGSPKNFRAPQHVRLHPSKPYFCFAPAVAGKFMIEPGNKYVSRYRFLVMSEAADAERIDGQWKRYHAESK